MRSVTPWTVLMLLAVACAEETPPTSESATTPAGRTSTASDPAASGPPDAAPADASRPDPSKAPGNGGSAAASARTGAQEASAQEFQLLSSLYADLYTRRIEEAIGTLDQMIALRPEDPWVHHQLGRALTMDSMQRDLDEAMVELRRAEELGQREAKVDMAAIHLDRGELPEAQQLLQQFLEAYRSQRPAAQGPGASAGAPPDPFVAQAHIQQARFFLMSEQLDKVAAALDRGRKTAARYMKRPDASPLGGQQVLEQLDLAHEIEVQWLVQSGDTAAALVAARALTEQQPSSPAIRDLYATALQAAGDEEEARRQTRAGELIRRLNDQLQKVLVPIEELEAEFAELEAIPPRSLPVKLVLAKACMARKLYPRVIELCQEVRLEAADVQLIGETWLMEARAQGISGNQERAMECFNEGTSLLPPFLAPAVQKMREQLSPGSRPSGGADADR